MADHGFWSYANRDADAVALVDPDERQWTRGELHALCNRIVGVLRDLGLERGDAVIVDSASRPLRMIRAASRPYFAVLREKLRWTER